jgi:uncharacterized membrane protein YfcA
VPVLFEIFRTLAVPDSVRMQLCVGTSLAIIVPTTVRSYRAHRMKGIALPEVIRLWTAPAIVGVVVGSVAAALAPGGMFKLAFALIAGTIAAKLLFGRESWVVSAELPGRNGTAGYGFLVGLASSLIGISGGSVVTMILTLHGKTIHQSVATAAGIGVPIAIAGTIGYALAGLPHQSELPPLSIGYVSVIGVLLIAPISSSVAPFGARLAHRLKRRTMEIGFGLFLLAAALRFIVSLI